MNDQISSRIPSLLEPYLALLPESSLILLTGVLGATTNWLVLRYLYACLRGTTSLATRRSLAVGGTGGTQEGPQQEEEEVGVVLVSFLRDGSFWREGAGKLGLDLDGETRRGKYVFLDGLTGLFSGHEAGDGKEKMLKYSSLDSITTNIETALSEVKLSRRVLIIDGLDLLLAASGDITSIRMQNKLLTLREHAFATIITLATDNPLLHTQTTTLEKEHAALVLSQAHAADWTLGLRRLDTGSAKDVSGVLRVTGQADEEGKEYLYYVSGDGGVKIFERGG